MPFLQKGTSLKQPSTPNRDRAQILSLAWPAILNNALITFIWIADMIMVGRLGKTAVAAVGISGQMLNMVMAITLAVTTGTTALVARFTGAKEKDRANLVLGQSLLVGAIMAVILVAPVVLASETFFRVFGAEPEVARIGAPYLRIVLSSTFFLVLALVAGAALRGAGDTKTPLVITVGANLIHVALNYGLIFGKFGLPRLEVIGCGIATVATFLLEAVAFVYLFWRGKLVLSLPQNLFQFNKEIVLKTMRIGIPSALEQGIMQIGYIWYLAAYTIGVNIMSLSFMPGFGFAIAASTLVGQHLGAKDPDRAQSQGWECARLALWVMSILGVVLLVAAQPIARIYVADGSVVGLTARFTRILALCQPAMALHFTLSGALAGAADTRWPLYGSFVGMYLIRLPLALLATHVLHLNITWIWLIIMADHYGKVAVVTIRFLSGKWKNILL